MRRPLSTVLVVAALGAVPLGVTCTVDRGPLEERVFGCHSDEECAAGFGCQVVDAAGNGFCAPRRSAGCEGIVTDAGLCIASCTVDLDDTRGGCPEGLRCLRGDLLTDAGYCVKVDDLCTRDSDCAGGATGTERCLATMLDTYFEPFLRGNDHLNRLTCVRVGCDQDGVDCLDDQSCLPGSLTGIGDFCARSCSGALRCPPGTACLGTPGSGFEYCLPTNIGSACEDDLGCQAGRCVSGSCQPRASACTEGDRTHCSSDERIDGDLNLWRCVGDACEWRAGHLQECNLQSMQCAAELECLETGSPDLPERICIQTCAGHAECGENAYCVDDAASEVRICAFRANEGGLCVQDEGCRQGLFCDFTCDPEQPDLGCCARPAE